MCLQRRSVLSTLCLLLVAATPTAAILWKACLDRVHKEYPNVADHTQHPHLFQAGSTPADPLVTLTGCDTLCGGPGPHFYSDSGSILNAWVLPALMLLTQKAIRDDNGWWDTVHILANPFDWFRGILKTIDEARSCLRFAENELGSDTPEQIRLQYQQLAWYQRFIAWTRWKHPAETALQREKRIMATYLHALKTAINMNVRDASVVHKIMTSSLSTKRQFKIQHAIALEIAKTRSGRLLLALIALVLYIWQAISAFVTTVGGSWTTVPGGRIALAMFSHWLIAAILLSNVVGSFPTQRFCRKTVESIYAEYGLKLKWTKDDSAIETGIELDKLSGATLITTTEVLPPNSSTDDVTRSSQPKNNRRNNLRQIYLLTLSILPVLSPVVNSLALLWYLPPTGPNCRFFLLLGITLVYIANALAAPFNRRHELFNRWKDFGIASTTTLLIILSACGMFNTCACWSGIYTRPRSEAFI
ncbi:hypothetical protein EJ04DRAFT_574247, partial [Polyplosphaeria fusca]